MAKSGCSAAWLARLNGVQEVVGSNPATPTILILYEFQEGRVCSFPQSYIDRHVSIQREQRNPRAAIETQPKDHRSFPSLRKGRHRGCKKTFPKKKFLDGNIID